MSDAGAPLHAGVFSTDGVFSVEAIHAAGRPIFFNNNGIHPGEPEGIDADTAALFPDSFEESELGLIPKRWEVKTIGEVSEILNGYAFKSDDYVNEDDGVFVLRTTNFSDSGFAVRLDKDVFLPKPFFKTYEKRIVIQPVFIFIAKIIICNLKIFLAFESLECSF